MRHTIIFLATVAAGSLWSGNAASESIRVWEGFILDVEHSTYRDFTLSTSETAYYTLPADTGLHFVTTADGPHVVALFGDMTNGINNPLTWSTPLVSYTVDENHGFIAPRTDPPVRAFSSYLTRSSVDLIGWTIDQLRVEHTQGGGLRRYNVEVWAHVPEPSPGLLLVAMYVSLAHVRMAPRRRSTVR